MQEITVGFENTVYTVTERQGMVEISVVVTSPPSGGTPLDFSLSVMLQNSTAGYYYQLAIFKNLSC